MNDTLKSYDVVIVGGGPAGLSAALMFGRARKSALLCDGGTPRNARAHGVHNFLTRDGMPPSEMRAEALKQIAVYPTVETRSELVAQVAKVGARFEVSLASGVKVAARRVLLATGVVDIVPEIPGFSEVWGYSSYQCPYCHGYEVRDKAWAVCVTSAPYVDWGLLMLGWTRDVTIVTHGATLDEESLAKLASAGLPVMTSKIARVDQRDGQIEALVLEDGSRVVCDAFFYKPDQKPVALVAALGLELDERGIVKVSMMRESSLAGVHVAGDASTMMQGAAMAAAEGTMTAAMMNHALTLESALGGH